MNFIEFWKFLFCFAWMPLYIGGSSKSSSDTTTQNYTQNTAYNTDKRAVASEEAIAVTGDGNAVNRSISNSTTFVDGSNRSTNFSDSSNRSTNFSDSSNHSTYFSDASVRDAGNTTITTYTTSDYGSVGAALSGMGAISSRAVDLADSSIMGALDSMNRIAAQNTDVVMRAFNMSNAASANSMQSSAQVLGFAQDAINKTNGAFADAKDGGTNKTIQLAVVAAIAAISFAAFMR